MTSINLPGTWLRWALVSHMNGAESPQVRFGEVDCRTTWIESLKNTEINYIYQPNGAEFRPATVSRTRHAVKRTRIVKRFPLCWRLGAQQQKLENRQQKSRHNLGWCLVEKYWDNEFSLMAMYCSFLAKVFWDIRTFHQQHIQRDFCGSLLSSTVMRLGMTSRGAWGRHIPEELRKDSGWWIPQPCLHTTVPHDTILLGEYPALMSFDGDMYQFEKQ